MKIGETWRYRKQAMFFLKDYVKKNLSTSDYVGYLDAFRVKITKIENDLVTFCWLKNNDGIWKKVEKYDNVLKSEDFLRNFERDWKIKLS